MNGHNAETSVCPMQQSEEQLTLYRSDVLKFSKIAITHIIMPACLDQGVESRMWAGCY